MKIAAFNIQRFGKSKLSDPFIMKTLIKVRPVHTCRRSRVTWNTCEALHLIVALLLNQWCLCLINVWNIRLILHGRSRMCGTMTIVICFHVTPLLQIVSRYDIIVILEVVDSSGESVDDFLEELNKWVKQACFCHVKARYYMTLVVNMTDYSSTGSTRRIITPWRSAHAWVEGVTKNSLCFFTGNCHIENAIDFF